MAYLEKQHAFLKENILFHELVGKSKAQLGNNNSLAAFKSHNMSLIDSNGDLLVTTLMVVDNDERAL
jgi:hypothetical protein